MNKAIIVLQREYVTRVRKKSFVIMTLLIPFLFAAFTILPAWLAMQKDDEVRTIGIYDESGIFGGKFEDNEYTHFVHIPKEEYEREKSKLAGSAFYALLYIPADITVSNRAEMFAERQIPMDLKNRVADHLGKTIEAGKKQAIIEQIGIPDLEERLAATRTHIQLATIKVTEKGDAVKSSAEAAMVAGYAAGFIIYMFVFIYGAMVMRGVMEEKTNRIVEVIISSVKPTQLMFGKIVGIGLVGLTQLVFWVVIGSAIVMGVQAFAGGDAMQQTQMAAESGAGQNMAIQVTEAITNLNMPLLLSCFLFYFLCGFLLYSSLMGAVGAAVNNEEETQQFMLPVTVPLIFSIIVLFPAINNPEGPLAFWASMIPFTSPVIMMARVPFGVPTWELILSMLILLLSIWGIIWVAGKIYRTGILMYGKKVNLKEILKWITYRN
ncbi:MAG: ABC transporter permease [Prolixibacteraceae bacterium]